MSNTEPDNKLHIIFVGGFRRSTRDGSFGGQIQACRTLIESQISNYVKWFLIDTTIHSYPPPSIIIRIYNSIGRLLYLLKYLVFEKINSVLIFSSSGYSAYEKGMMVFISKLFKKKVALSIRSGYIQKEINESQVMRWYIRNVINKCDILICQSQYWKDYYNNIAGKEKDNIRIINNWIEINENKININKNGKEKEITILYMSILNKSKGIYDLINMVIKYRLEYKNCRFVICGKGPAFNDIKKMIEDNKLENIFKLEGWITGDEKKLLLNKSDMFVLPSYAEGMPNSILEAMSASMPIVSTNVGAIPELVKNEINGFIVSPGDIDGLHTSITKLIQDTELRVTMGVNSRKRVISNHDISKIWVDIYEILKYNEK